MPSSAPDAAGIHLVLGGARSGKSAFAERLVEGSGRAPVYLATAQTFDGEMESRVATHRARRGPLWHTVEEPLDLCGSLREHAKARTSVLVDCLTLWVTNLMIAERTVDAEGEALSETLAAMGDGVSVVIVSNEVGQGIVPDNAMARAFRDHAGALHQRVAEVAHHVWFVTAGLPQKLK